MNADDADDADDTDDTDAAAALDAEITAALRGRPASNADSTVLWLAAALRAEPPASAYRRVDRAVRRRWSVGQLLAAALAAVFMAHGVGNFIAGEWVSRNIGEPYGPHAFFEFGLALVAVAGAVAAGALRREWLPVAVVAGAPLGLLYAAHGVSEITVFAWGAALHMSEGLLAIALAVVWWRTSRYSGGRTQEGKT